MSPRPIHRYPPRPGSPTPVLGGNRCGGGLFMLTGVVQSIGYHRRTPWRKFNVRPENRPRRVQWTSHGHLRSGRGCCGLTNPHSPLRALAIDLGLSNHQTKSIILTISTKFSTRAGRTGWFGVDFVGASSLNLCVFGVKQCWIQQPVTNVMEPHLLRSRVGGSGGG